MINCNTNDLNLIYKNIKISTITSNCELNSKLNLDNIFNYIDIDKNNILCIKYKGKIKILKSEMKPSKNKFKNFSHQITMAIRIFGKKKISLKLFENGTLQITGCRGIDDFNILFTKLINKLEIRKFYLDNLQNINFYENTEKLSIKNIVIRMINCGFTLNKIINREKLYLLLKENNIKCRYESLIRASVDISYFINNKKVSIFVFNSGEILIIGKLLGSEINNAHDFISNFIKKYEDEIVIKSYVDILDKYLSKIVQIEDSKFS